MSLFILLALGLLLPFCDQLFYLPMLPEIQENFQLSLSSVLVSVSLGYLGFACGTIFWQRFKEKKILLISAGTLYIVSMLVLLCASNYILFSSMRFLQGFSLAALSMLLPLITTDQGKERLLNRVAIVFGFSVMFLPTVIPLLGGVLLQYLPWRYALLPLLGLTAFLFYRFYHQIKKPLPTNLIDITPLRWLPMLSCIKRDKRMLFDISLITLCITSLILFFLWGGAFLRTSLELTPLQFASLGIVMTISLLTAFFLSHSLSSFLSDRHIALWASSFFLIGCGLFGFFALIGLIAPNHPYLSVALTSFTLTFAWMGMGIMLSQSFKYLWHTIDQEIPARRQALYCLSSFSLSISTFFLALFPIKNLLIIFPSSLFFIGVAMLLIVRKKYFLLSNSIKDINY